MSEAWYEDSGLRLDEDGITIRRYYFPLAGAKRIPYSEIRGIKTEEMTWNSGKGRVWGAGDPRYWFPLDIRRAGKRTLIVLELGRHVRPCITPDDPDRVIELLRERAPIT
ncbi:hypothetical protein [Mycobacterium sp. pR1184]|uniref:PH domain-containing protein n=1 Tax=Mycobacterium sp. pR1184 TaxID=3238981 RepID=UPI00351BAE98